MMWNFMSVGRGGMGRRALFNPPYWCSLFIVSEQTLGMQTSIPANSPWKLFKLCKQYLQGPFVALLICSFSWTLLQLKNLCSNFYPLQRWEKRFYSLPCFKLIDNLFIHFFIDRDALNVFNMPTTLRGAGYGIAHLQGAPSLQYQIKHGDSR